ncbi:hypothetical protein [Schaalia sp. Marseille-Q2122]|uniref:hypothetical protein n=1 Tax=Schaalia sp. Marseille-Q2122 TaxID=2736604 RepID=UPI00158AED9D|nr:hypothetical protein [Schaalia sp. Marseille-Q2122]
MSEEALYKPQEICALAIQVTHSAERPAKRAEELVMDTASYQDAGKWGDGDLFVTQAFGDLYGSRLLELEGQIHNLARKIVDFSEHVKQAAEKAVISDEMVAEQMSLTGRLLNADGADSLTAPRRNGWGS